MRLLKIGRDPACDIVINSPEVSALHAELTLLNNGDILLEDKHSLNGTFVMNRPVKPGSHVNVKRGDYIRFGNGNADLIWDQVPTPEDLSKYKSIHSIGSSMLNDIQVGGNTVSRYHATLKVDKKGNAWLEDHSKNGTTVNGQKVSHGQTVKVKRGDAVAVGGVPVSISSFIPSNNTPLIIGIAAAVVILLVGVWAAFKFINWSTVNPSTTQALENASACVYGGYIYEITVDDDPFKSNVKEWPQKWYAGIYNGQFVVTDKPEYLKPFTYTGTAFFISENGEMGTNRHVAVPWEYRTSDIEEEIRQQMKIIRNNHQIIQTIDLMKTYNLENPLVLDAWKERFQNSPITISGQLSYFGIGLTGSKINNQLDLQQAQVIAESGDPKKDVALIRLNSRKTPEHLVKMGAIYDLSKARTDERQLQPQEENLVVVGYPGGETINNESFDGKELRPTIHKTSLSKVPDDNAMQIQTVGIGGQSGSPVSDSKHRLVGVLCSGFNNTEVTFACNIKHLIELYEKNKVRD